MMDYSFNQLHRLVVIVERILIYTNTSSTLKIIYTLPNLIYRSYLNTKHIKIFKVQVNVNHLEVHLLPAYKVNLNPTSYAMYTRYTKIEKRNRQ